MSKVGKKIIIGFVALLLSAILQAVFLCSFHNNWIVLVFACIYAIIFLKYLEDEKVIAFLNKKFSKQLLKMAGVIMVFMGLSFLPNYAEGNYTWIQEFVFYTISFICWMLGLFLFTVSGKR